MARYAQIIRPLNESKTYLYSGRTNFMRPCSDTNFSASGIAASTWERMHIRNHLTTNTRVY